jgi:hypothetical protein
MHGPNPGSYSAILGFLPASRAFAAFANRDGSSFLGQTTTRWAAVR